jgi:hypothetical protein
MERRSVFAVGALVALVLLAGCSAAGSLDMEVATDDSVTREASRAVPGTADEAGETGVVVRAAIENGTTTARSREPLVTPGLPFRSGGRYYNVSASVIDRQPGTAYRLGIDYNGTAGDGATVAYENLSARDRAVVDKVLPPIPVTADPGPDYYVDATYTATERNRSVLLTADTEAVRYEGETYPIAVTESESVTVPTRRYTATVVANSTEAYAQRLRSEHVFTLAGLSDAERSVVTDAITDSYYADSDGDEAFAAVVERFQQERAVERNEFRGVWLVRYDGEVYVAELSYEGFEME